MQRNFVVFDNHLFFMTKDVDGWGLWKSDGTADGTTFVQAMHFSETPVVLGAKLFFPMFGDNGRELYSSDGTADGTVMVKQINTEVDERSGQAMSSEVVRALGVARWAWLLSPARAHRTPLAVPLTTCC